MTNEEINTHATNITYILNEDVKQYIKSKPIDEQSDISKIVISSVMCMFSTYILSFYKKEYFNKKEFELLIEDIFTFWKEIILEDMKLKEN